MNTEYEQISMDGFFYKKSAYYFLYKPFRVEYDTIIVEARSKGFEVTNTAILEKGVALGKGFIAVEINPKTVPTQYKQDVINLKGDYLSYMHIGAFTELKTAYKKIMDEHKEAKEFYNLYLTDPKVTKEEENKTMILFR